MSFQAYLDNIQAQTKKTPADFEKLAKKILLESGVKPESRGGARKRLWLRAGPRDGHLGGA
jgi:hypothetical protein